MKGTKKSLTVPEILPLEYPPRVHAPHLRTGTSANRLVRLVANTVVGPQQRLDFAYDHQGRRITKRVWNNTTRTGALAVDQKFLCDGWNLVAVLGADTTLLRSFAWGTDLSGTFQGVGGVGGLLWIHDLSTLNNQPSTHFVAHDGNGNVSLLVNAADGTDSARYEYGPFGEVIRATGPMAKSNPFRFSTQYQDDETDLVCYLHRYYNPSAGRWLSRDPLGERGGANAYGFIGNEPVNDVDVLGLLAASVVSVEYSGHGSAEKNGASSQYVAIDNLIKGQVPLKASDSEPAASVTATLDDSFNADIRAWTMLSAVKSLTALQMSTDLKGDITVSCPCPFRRVRANWSVSAALRGTGGNATSTFEGNNATTAWNKPSVTRSGSVYKALDSSYRARFRFVLGQTWYDTLKSSPTTSHVNVHASVECIE
ncbi:MAG: RHS repeat-associated core domain-containing protein [Verrucomicrobia bacterium]|nr:RHS repeat-associated core domain-containing protein [Verrucomicrobiota bacterium]